MPAIEDVEKALLARAPGASVEDLGTIAAAMQAMSEARLSELSARTKHREYRLEFIKSLSAFLVPLLSVAALLITIQGQNRQIAAARQQIEDTEWRDVLTSLKKPTEESVYTDPTIAPRLRSFFASPVYGQQAREVASRLMGHMSNPDGFHDLFSAVFGEVNSGDIVAVLDISRQLHASERALQTTCNDLLKLRHIDLTPHIEDCGEHATDQEALEEMANKKVPDEIVTDRRADLQLVKETRIINQKIFAFLRANYHKPRDYKTSSSLDLSDTFNLQKDFSDLDLTGFNLSNTLFDQIDLTGAIISPKPDLGSLGDDERPDFRGSIWWEAESISPQLLLYLIDNYYPYAWSSETFPPGFHVDRAHYRDRVAYLCARAHVLCPQEPKFGSH